MHLRNINARNAAARESIRAAAGALADGLGLAPLAHPTAIEWRDPAVGQMRELECVAALLDAVAVALLTKGENNGRSQTE